MSATKPASVNLYSFTPLSFGKTELNEKTKRLIVTFPLTYVIFTGDYDFKEKRFVSVKCNEPYVIISNSDTRFGTIDDVVSFLLYEKEKVLQHFIKETRKSISKAGVK